MNTSPPAPEQKHILVTGGTGFFGRSLLALLARGNFPEFRFTLCARNAEEFSRLHPEWRSPRVRFLSADVRTLRFPAEKIDFVIHAAAPAVLPESCPAQRDIILAGTEHVLAEAARTGVKRMLNISSGAVYGRQQAEFQPETGPLSPTTSYGRAKLEAEECCAASPVPSVHARCFAFVGPHLPEDIHFAAGNFLRDARNGGPIVVNGDGTPLRSWMYADDLIVWLMEILLRGKPGSAYNVGSEEACSIRSLAELVATLSGNGPTVEVHGTPLPGAIPERYVPSVRKARETLGLRPAFDLRRALAATMEYRQLQKG